MVLWDRTALARLEAGSQARTSFTKEQVSRRGVGGHPGHAREAGNAAPPIAIEWVFGATA